MKSEQKESTSIVKSEATGSDSAGGWGNLRVARASDNLTVAVQCVLKNARGLHLRAGESYWAQGSTAAAETGIAFPELALALKGRKGYLWTVV